MQTFDTPGPIQMTLRLISGDITVDAADTHETEVDLRGSGDEASEQAVAQARVELRGSELVVDVPKVRGGFLRGDAEVTLRIRCPHGSSLEVQTRSADLAARGRFERVEATSVSGDVSIHEAGRTSIRTTSGDVRIERCGDLEATTTSGDIRALAVHGRAGVKSVSGDITIGDLTGDLTASTVSGDQRIDGVVAGELNLTAVSGDVAVGVRRGARVWVDARSMSGATTSELDLADGPGAEPEGDGPLVELRVQTISGDVSVRRAAAPTTAG
jgi:DUF4097 and DUF4098 domain-containing protein YvlB